jgi:RNA polymerase sigma factor (sigma-70 family)
MAHSSTDAAFSNDLRTLYRVGAVGGLTDGQLLKGFLAGRDEAAFSALADRHGPMVLRVCRQVLGDSHNAQDAFQATFLVLARKADSVQKQDSVASWLHGVARRVACRVKADEARRRTHEKRVATELGERSSVEETPPESWPELHEEIARLPERYRESVVLCYLEGLSTEAAAVRLGCPRGTVLSRLARARDQLRDRLTRRGLAPTASLVAGTGALPGAAIPTDLLDATVRMCLGFMERQETAAALASARVVDLARGVLFAMTITKLKVLGAAGLACVLILGGVPSFAYQFAKTTPARKKAEQKNALDARVEKLQAALDVSSAQILLLQQELRTLQAEIRTLRGGAANLDLPTKALEEYQKIVPAEELPKQAEPGVGVPKQAIPGEGIPKQAMPRKGVDKRNIPKTDIPEDHSGIGGIGGGLGQSNFAFGGGDELSYVKQGNLILAISPIGDTVTVYNTTTSKAKSVRLTASKEAPLKVVPITGGVLIALMLEGTKISEVAVYDMSEAAWHVQKLRKPFNGQVSPIVGRSVVAWVMDRTIYAYGYNANQWSVLELPEGIPPTPIVSADKVTLEKAGHIYEFDGSTGDWKHIDIRAIIKEAQEKEEKDKGDTPKS